MTILVYCFIVPNELFCASCDLDKYVLTHTTIGRRNVFHKTIVLNDMKVEIVQEIYLMLPPLTGIPRPEDISFTIKGQCSVPQIPNVGTKIFAPFFGEEDVFLETGPVPMNVSEVRFIWKEKGVLFPSLSIESLAIATCHAENLEYSAEKLFNCYIQGTAAWYFNTNQDFLMKFGKIHEQNVFEINGPFFQALLNHLSVWENS